LARVTGGFRLESVDVMTRSRVWLPGSCVWKLTCRVRLVSWNIERKAMA